MIFYFAWFTITAFLLLLKKQKSKINIIIIFILFTLVYGSRNYGGVDDVTYISAFNNVLSGVEVYGLEDSFLLISKFFGVLGLNYKAVFLFYASISFTFMYFSYIELCKTKRDWIIAILGFFVFSFIPTITVMRQFAAAAIITYALILKLKGKNKLSLIFIGFASLFHLGSVIGFIIFPLLSIKLKASTKAIVPIICLAIGYFGYFNNILKSFMYLIPNKYLGYLDNFTNTEPHIGILHLILIIIYLFQFMLTTINKSNESPDKTIDFLERTQMVYFSIYFITLSNGWMNRLSIYFILFLPFIFTTFTSRFSLSRDKDLLYALCYGALVILFLYQIINLPNSVNMSDLIPYSGSFDFKR
ncbi:hypothetical protein HMPREF1210_01700 [Paenisporosarcina sp. HGH0030]|uniref:EpsG family protein n=1 Tax=Paenisporosarcina sp. HGH0030 TaxID=1078085 RepID=UPI00034E7749|nr:EpsG family protein [Paenisporosarcina sp. HGH0030]EPD52347.1 hypothetical protein HMPREF1210_01700 [Paenisporosarcina sp. HGH0030]